MVSTQSDYLSKGTDIDVSIEGVVDPWQYYNVRSFCSVNSWWK